MPFKGTLNHTGFTVDLIGGTNNTDGTAATVAFIVKRDRYTTVDTFTAAPSTQASASYTPASAEIRMVITVTPPAGGTALLRVTQGGTKIEDPVNGDMTFVYDLI